MDEFANKNLNNNTPFTWFSLLDICLRNILFAVISHETSTVWSERRKKKISAKWCCESESTPNRNKQITFRRVWLHLPFAVFFSFYFIRICFNSSQKMVEKADDRLLPANKIRTIMKSCGDPNALLSRESILVVTKAAVSAIPFFNYLFQFRISEGTIFRILFHRNYLLHF